VIRLSAGDASPPAPGCSRPAGRSRSRARTRARGLIHRLAATLTCVSLLWQPLSGIVLLPSDAAADETLAPPETILADPLLREISTELDAAGYTIVPSYQDQRREGDFLVGTMLIETKGPRGVPELADPEWSTAVPIMVLTFQRESELVAVAEVRLEAESPSWIFQLSSSRTPDLRVRAIDPASQNPRRSSRLEFLGRLPGGGFDRLEERPDGTLAYLHHPGVAAPANAQGFKDCMKYCFLDVQFTLSWLQGICFAACLLAAGIAALASGGSAAVPVVIACLKVCGLAFLVVRAGHLAACLVACALQ
jgi:hypothetical protein